MLSYSLKHRGVESYCSDLHNIVLTVLLASDDFKNEAHPKDKKGKEETHRCEGIESLVRL